MNEVYVTALEVQEFCQRRDWKFCIIGGVAVHRWGEMRSSEWLVANERPLRTCSAEDLLVHKCLANRDRDWTDVTGILARQIGKLNFDLVRAELKPLLELKGEPEIAERLELEIKRVAQPFKVIQPAVRTRESRNRLDVERNEFAQSIASAR